MGRTACTEPQCLYKGAIYLYLITVKVKGHKKLHKIHFCGKHFNAHKLQGVKLRYSNDLIEMPLNLCNVCNLVTLQMLTRNLL